MKNIILLCALLTVTWTKANPIDDVSCWELFEGETKVAEFQQNEPSYDVLSDLYRAEFIYSENAGAFKMRVIDIEGTSSDWSNTVYYRARRKGFLAAVYGLLLLDEKQKPIKKNKDITPYGN